MWNRLKKLEIRTKIFLLFVIILIGSNILLFLIISDFEWISAPHDVDRRSNGNTLICTTTFAEMLQEPKRVENQIPVESDNADHKVYEVDGNGNLIWELRDLAYPHEVEELPNGHLLIADTGFDRLIEVNYPGTDIVWSWEPSKINWTEINPAWGSDHYYNNKIAFDWSHLNDVDFKQYETWNACLVSIRNFDLIVEINYTAESIGPSNNPANIVWWYGEYENRSLIYRQHNPDYLENGNIIIADSANDRILEINKTSKQIVWSYADGLRWPRDADVLNNGDILITDSFNCRISVIEKESKELIWSYNSDLIVPYEADLLDNGNFLVSGEYAGVVYEVNRNGMVVWRYGLSYVKSVVYLNSILLMAIASTELFFRYRKIRSDSLTPKGKFIEFTVIGILIVLIILGITLMLAYSFFIMTIAQFVYANPHLMT